MNAFTHAPLLPRLATAAAGLEHREIPLFAGETLRQWWRRRGTDRAGGARGSRPGSRPAGSRGTVMLWPDTFTNTFHPHIGRAAVELLEDAGWEVRMPEQTLCCGLTWISTGQLATAKKVLRRTIDALAEHLRSGGFVVGLEPSCTTVFRSDAADLLGSDDDVERLRKQTLTLAELLTEHTPDWTPPSLDGVHALAQVHCHQHAVLGWDADAELLSRAGARAERLDSGCCGLAGNFGFEAGHLEVSQACAESVLLPSARGAEPGTAILADGFSCRTQLHELDSGGREGVHLAELLARGLPGRRHSPSSAAAGVGAEAGRNDLEPGDRPRTPSPLARAAALAGTALVAGAVGTLAARLGSRAATRLTGRRTSRRTRGRTGR